MAEPGAMLARQVRPGDRLYLATPDGEREERTVLSMDPNVDGYVELEFTDGTIRMFKGTATVLVLSP